MYDRFVVLTGGMDRNEQKVGSMTIFDAKERGWSVSYPAK